MGVDVERLREDMKQDSLGAFFGGGFGGALVEEGDIERAKPDELVKMAEDKGINLDQYNR